MKVNALHTIKNIAVFLIIFYVDAQLLDKLTNARNASDIIVYLVSLFFMLTILIVHSYLFYERVNPKEKENQND
jgi:hypothetical protein|nr:MAG TPA: hypothetical protein [Caudoviricetes sp.]